MMFYLKKIDINVLFGKLSFWFSAFLAKKINAYIAFTFLYDYQ
jgi:hypothetical protein